MSPSATACFRHTARALAVGPLLLLHILHLSAAAATATATSPLITAAHDSAIRATTTTASITPPNPSALPPVLLRDVSVAAGLQYSMGPKLTYGGPSIADLDDDGYPDLLFTHHNWFIEIYFNQRDGTFTRLPLSVLKIWQDNHALNAFRYDSQSSSVYFSLSRGGAYGRRPSHHRVWRISRDRSIEEVSAAAGYTAHGGRGRSTLYLNLRGPGSSLAHRTDMLSLNAARNDKKFPHHVAFRNRNSEPSFALENARGYGANNNWYAAPVDFDNDGRIDVVSFQTLRFHSVTGRFNLTDVTAQVLPPGFAPDAVVAVVEMDFDNDGKWDLYVATTRTGDLRWHKNNRPFRDYLLRNVGGRYVDVTDGAGIPQDGYTRGVTAADLDNDGLIDLVVCKYWGRSVVLRNLGGGKFRAQRSVVPKRRGPGPGDSAVAVDYDLDGRIDLVMSEGDSIEEDKGGYYRIFRNVSPRSANGHYLLVRVGHSPNGRATPLHAVVRVRVGDTWMSRRVGPNGVAVSISLIETLHFGLGKATVADRVVVTWLDGAERWLKNQEVDLVLTVGRVAPIIKL